MSSKGPRWVWAEEGGAKTRCAAAREPASVRLRRRTAPPSGLAGLRPAFARFPEATSPHRDTSAMKLQSRQKPDPWFPPTPAPCRRLARHEIVTARPAYSHRPARRGIAAARPADSPRPARREIVATLTANKSGVFFPLPLLRRRENPVRKRAPFPAWGSAPKKACRQTLRSGGCANLCCAVC